MGHVDGAKTGVSVIVGVHAETELAAGPSGRGAPMVVVVLEAGHPFMVADFLPFLLLAQAGLLLQVLQFLPRALALLVAEAVLVRVLALMSLLDKFKLKKP